ncbi:hypothetical protein LXL04_026988 [Taraxacum kok-saghyz]
MMDGNEKEGAQRFYNKCYYLFFHNFTLRLLHLLLPMAILLSFFLTFTSYNSYHYNHLSVFLLPLFTHTFEKKYLFILCTSILAFITNNNQHLDLKDNIHHDGATILEENLQEFEYDYEYGKLDEQESKEEHGKIMENNEKESGVLMEDEEDDGEVFEEEGFLGGSSCVEDEQEEMNMDTEELNEKIEEFIRKMRQELRVEA